MRDQTRALECALILARLHKTTIRVYAVDVPEDAWGHSREYYVGHLPPPGVDVAWIADIDPDSSVTYQPV